VCEEQARENSAVMRTGGQYSASRAMSTTLWTLFCGHFFVDGVDARFCGTGVSNVITVLPPFTPVAVVEKF
jgi:hypothetical protein